MSKPCCCGEIPITSGSFSPACFCQKCPSIGEYSLCVAGLTTNEVSPDANDLYPCLPPFSSIGSHPIPLRRGPSEYPGSVWLGVSSPARPRAGEHCNCNYYGAVLEDTGSTGCMSRRTVDGRPGMEWQVRQNNRLTAWLELEELCLQHDPTAATGRLKRGIREDFDCFGEADWSWNPSQPREEWLFGATGFPCSPCYNNTGGRGTAAHNFGWPGIGTGNIRGSINPSVPFSMECGDEHEQYVNVSSACPAGNDLTHNRWLIGATNGDIDECDNIAADPNVVASATVTITDHTKLNAGDKVTLRATSAPLTDINFILNEDIAASATVTIIDYSELNTGDKVILRTTLAPNIDVEFVVDLSGLSGWDPGSSNSDAAYALETVINLNPDFLASVYNEVITITQYVAGESGNTPVGLIDSGNVGMSKTDFTGGADSAWHLGSSNSDAALSLTDSIDANLHFSASVNNEVITITQSTGGEDGNTRVVLTDSGLPGMSKTDFTGGGLGGLDGKYFWITDDVGDKFHVWLKKSGTDSVDPNPTGSSGGIKVNLQPFKTQIYGVNRDNQRHNRDVKNCAELKQVIAWAINNEEIPERVAVGGRTWPAMPRWEVNPSSHSNYPPQPSFDPLCKPSIINWPEPVCTFCVNASNSGRSNGNQAATIYDENTGFEFGDGGADDFVGGMGNCCSGPAPRLFIEIPTLREETFIQPPRSFISYPPGYTVNIGGTGESDCVAGDPLCICYNAMAEEGANPGDPPVITDHGKNSHTLYEYGLSGDFDCWNCNVFSLRSVTGATNSDTSHVTLPQDVTVCPFGACKEKIGFLILLDRDMAYGCPDSETGGTWNTGSCMFGEDAAKLQQFIDMNDHLDVRIQVIKPVSQANVGLPSVTGNFCSPHDPLLLRTAYATGAQCGCYGFELGIGGITGGSLSGGGLPMGFMEVDHCAQITPDSDMYGWNKDSCCRPIAPAPDPNFSRGSVCMSPPKTGHDWGWPPAGPQCCCCIMPLNWSGGGIWSVGRVYPHCLTPDPHFRGMWVCYENACWECHPNEINRSGGAFEAGCSRVTADDIYAGWQSLTSGGTWIPDALHFWIDEAIAGLGGGPPNPPQSHPCWRDGTCKHRVYVENQDKMVCANVIPGGLTVPQERWRGAINEGEAPIEIEIDKIGDEIIDGALRILDDVEAMPPLSARACSNRVYTLTTGPNARWLGHVVDKLYMEYGCVQLDNCSGILCPPNPNLIDHDCPDRVQIMGADGVTPLPYVFSCGGEGSSNVGKVNRCKNTPRNHYTRFNTIERRSRLADHPLNMDRLYRQKQIERFETGPRGERVLVHRHVGDYFLNVPTRAGGRLVSPGSSLGRNACDCCPYCESPLGDATFTINAPSDCWLINHLTGAQIEDKKPLGGTFILPAQESGCRWGADFPNSFIDHVTMYRWDIGTSGFEWGHQLQGLTVVLYHRGNIVKSYELWDGDFANTNIWSPGASSVVPPTPVADWNCSGSITIPNLSANWFTPNRIAHGWNSHGLHVCDPCSWDESENAFARFVLYSGDWEGRVDPDRLATLNGAAITLTSTDGTIRTYTLKTDDSADPSLLEFNWDTSRLIAVDQHGRQERGTPVNTIVNLKSVVESASGHDGKITVEVRGDPYSGWKRDMLKFIQLQDGVAGNTDITYNLAFKDWCRLLPSYEWWSGNSNTPPRDLKSCPDKFQGGAWCRQEWQDWQGVTHSKVNCLPFATPPSSWPHSCPCKDWQGACLPPTITVTI